jgi:hypothetical protein
MAASLSAAAAQLDCSPSVLKKAKKAGAPGFRANGSVCISELRPWLEENLESLTDGESKEALECRRLLAQCEKLEYELAVTRGEYIHRSQYEADAIKVADLFRTELLAFHADQVTWEGLAAVERDKRGKERVRVTMENLKRALRV